MASSSKRKKIREMEKQDAAGISRRRHQRTMDFALYAFLKGVLLAALPLVYFLYSPALVFVVIAYAALAYGAILTERGMNKSVIRANHIHIPKFDSILAAVIVLIAYIGAVMGLFSVSHTPKFASGDAGMAFGGILMNLRRALSNFGSLLTGTRNVLSFGFGAVSPPSGHVPGAPSLDDLPLEYLFSLILSVLNTVLLCLMFILGIFSLCHTFVKRRKFAKVMNEIVLDGELKILSDEELEEILSFGEEKPTVPPPECPHAARGEEPAPVEAQTDTAARPSDGEEKT